MLHLLYCRQQYVITIAITRYFSLELTIYCNEPPSLIPPHIFLSILYDPFILLVVVTATGTPATVFHRCRFFRLRVLDGSDGRRQRPSVLRRILAKSTSCFII